MKKLREIIKSKKSNAIMAGIRVNSLKEDEEGHLYTQPLSHSRHNLPDHLKPLHEALNKHYESKIEGKHHDNLHNYTSIHSYTYNSHLWNKHKNEYQIGDPKVMQARDKGIDSLNKTLNKYKTPTDFHVYSGTRHDPRIMKNEEGIVHHPSFLSTSINRARAQGFATTHQSDAHDGKRHVLKIHVPKGHAGAYLGNEHSDYPSETEFLLPKGLNLKYHKTEKITTKSHDIGEGNPKEYFIHHMSIVKPDNAIMAGIHSDRKPIKEEHHYKDSDEDSIEHELNKFPSHLNPLYNTLNDHYNHNDFSFKNIKHYHSDEFRAYTAGDSGVMNSHLWQDHKSPGSSNYKNTREVKNGIPSLHDALHAYKTPEDFHVYSGTKHDPRELKDSNNIVHHPAFLSTSIVKARGQDFATRNPIKKTEPEFEHNVLKIHVPKGHAGAFIHRHSEYPEEHEFLLPKGLNLKYHHTTKETRRTLIGGGSMKHFNIHHMSIEPESKE